MAALATDICVGFCFVFFLHGDNNYSDDRGLYARGQNWLNKHHIMGRAVGCVCGRTLWWQLLLCTVLVQTVESELSAGMFETQPQH